MAALPHFCWSIFGGLASSHDKIPCLELIDACIGGAVSQSVGYRRITKVQVRSGAQLLLNACDS